MHGLFRYRLSYNLLKCVRRFRSLLIRKCTKFNLRNYSINKIIMNDLNRKVFCLKLRYVEATSVIVNCLIWLSRAFLPILFDILRSTRTCTRLNKAHRRMRHLFASCIKKQWASSCRVSGARRNSRTEPKSRELLDLESIFPQTICMSFYVFFILPLCYNAVEVMGITSERFKKMYGLKMVERRWRVLVLWSEKFGMYFSLISIMIFFSCGFSIKKMYFWISENYFIRQLLYKLSFLRIK